MQKPVHSGAKSYLKKHGISISLLIILALATTATNYSLIAHGNSNIETTKKARAAQTATDNTTIAAIKARKAAELVAQQAAATATANQSQTADESTASNIDSSTCNNSKTHKDPASIDVVVNKKHCMQPVTYAPSDLQTANGATLSAKALPAYVQLFNAATAAGEAFYTTSSYRSYADQVSTYAYWVNTSGIDGADTYSARPGYSEHQTGLAFDVAATVNGKNYVLSDFDKTSQYQWLQSHAADYGFIQRYYVGSEATTGYEAEEWHYRYVGVAIAKDMKAKNIKTLEQYWGISGGSY